MGWRVFSGATLTHTHLLSVYCIWKYGGEVAVWDPLPVHSDSGMCGTAGRAVEWVHDVISGFCMQGVGMGK